MREIQAKQYGSSAEEAITSSEEEQENHYRKSSIWGGFKNKFFLIKLTCLFIFIFSVL